MTTNETAPLLRDEATERRIYTSPDNSVPGPDHGGFSTTNLKPIRMASIVRNGSRWNIIFGFWNYAQVIPMAIGVFLAAMDNTIVVSSYAAIGSELKQLQNTSWVATGYMLTLTSFQWVVTTYDSELTGKHRDVVCFQVFIIRAGRWTASYQDGVARRTENRDGPSWSLQWWRALPCNGDFGTK